MPSRKGNTQLSPFIYCKGVNCIYNLIFLSKFSLFSPPPIPYRKITGSAPVVSQDRSSPYHFAILGKHLKSP